jgi:hypothetical protein
MPLCCDAMTANCSFQSAIQSPGETIQYSMVYCVAKLWCLID